ncbi:M56 family metallopeptidase [Calothrix sp. NIES-3974]|uniref:M56 family metallopeptidase n=1 Tax=Calothrix sp. NIES-3974 TaxID=2005462 RepID=UPI000B5EF12D|nr:M56 family metallopeptidase [Calothrix sp. NIES-3974]BAZ04166.1 hypothetical protein NIES3974_07980 [Calothrix sp. NIES-3974]
MHMLMIVGTVVIAWCLRLGWQPSRGNWQQRYCSSLFYLLFPALLIFATAIALVCMGWQGRMGNWQTGYFSYLIAVFTLGVFTAILGKLAYQGLQMSRWANSCPTSQIDGYRLGILDSQALFAGQVGFWQPRLILSKGIIQTLSSDQLETVIAHEQGHLYYRDTFWFFWLGWIRTCTAWLPHTEALWEELLILRELRADAFAATRVDPLLLAESLLMVVSGSTISNDVFCAALDSSHQSDRLEQRIDALLTSGVKLEYLPRLNWHFFVLILLSFFPLVTILFHQ